METRTSTLLEKNCLHAIILLLLVTTGSPLASQKDDKYISPIAKKEKDNKPKTEKKFKIGYKGFIEAGVVTEGLNFNSVSFGGGFTSHGVHFNNIYLGIGAGIDKYDTLFMVPVVFDTRFIITGRKANINSGATNAPVKPKGFNLFLFFSGGYSNSLKEETNKKGSMFQSGIGILLGAQTDVRMTLTLGYKIQQLKDRTIGNTNSHLENFNIRMGVEFKT